MADALKGMGELKIREGFQMSNPLVEKLCELVPMATTPEARALLLRAIEIEEKKDKEPPVCPLCGSLLKKLSQCAILFMCGTSTDPSYTRGTWTVECQRIRDSRIP